MNGEPKVALFIETSNRYGRDLLYGVRDWMREGGGGRWAVRFSEQARRSPLPPWLPDWKGDGIIARVDSPDIARALRRTGLPVVDVSAERFASEFPRVSIDNTAVAELAVRHLLDKGLRHFAFCGDERFIWSRQRGVGFRRSLKGARYSCSDYEAGGAQPGSDAEIRALAAWVESLPKPVGIFACYDGRAQQVLEACQSAGVQVPDDVAVLGVDNDEVLCELCSPPLSSVLPNARRIGFEAAVMLSAMMRGEPPPARTSYVAPVRVVERQSTDAISVSDAKVAAAMRYIRQHACEGIRVDDVLKAVPMSRTLLERKFKAHVGHSPHRQIMNQKIDRARQLLVESELSVAVVAELTGFESASYLSVAFRREEGESPHAFRTRHRTRTA